MGKIHLLGLTIVLASAGSFLGGCASTNSYAGNDANYNGPVNTASADPMGAAIFGGSGQQNSPSVANLDSK